MLPRRALPFVLAGLVVVLGVAPATSAAGGGGARFVSPDEGGASYGAPSRKVDARPSVALLEVSPGRVRAGRLPDVRFRVAQRGMPAVDVRVAIVPVGEREASVSARLGPRATGETHRVRWPRRAVLAPGRYVVRLEAIDAAGHMLARSARASGRQALRVVPKPKPKREREAGPKQEQRPDPQESASSPPRRPEPPQTPPSRPSPAPSQPVSAAGEFPVAGPHAYGGDDADFGSPRDGHRHEGQDVTAAAGTPVVAPLAGTVTAVDFQRGGAGRYVVMRAVDGRDFFFAHLQRRSVLVSAGQPVAADAVLGRVGSTGSSSGPHLHFEIWRGGWRRGHPVDPLAQLRAWDR